jgi:DNA primase
MVLSKEQIELLKDKVCDDITKVFDVLGLEYTNKYDYFCMPCPIHGGDNPEGFSWSTRLNMFRCWTRGCHEKGSDVLSLIMHCKHKTFGEALKILNGIIGGTIETVDAREAAAEIAFKHYIKSNTPTQTVERKYSPDVLKSLKPHDYFINRGFSQDVLEKFHVGYVDNPKSKMYNRVVIPVISHIDNSIVGFTGRSIVEGIKPKWIHSARFRKAEHLFNMNNAIKHIRSSNSVILVEGPLDVFKFEMAGIYNSAAVFGTTLSGRQRSFLLSSNCFDVYLAMDGDTAGQNATHKMYRELKNYFTVYKYLIPKDKDVGDLNVEEIHQLEYERMMDED